MTTPRKMRSKKNRELEEDDPQGGAGSNCTKGSMSSQKGGGLSYETSGDRRKRKQQ